MAAYYRLQDLKSVNATGAQRIEEAIDISAFKTLTVQARKPVAATSGTLKLQHAAVLEEDAFTDVDSVDTGSPGFDLGTTGNEVLVYENLLRYVRWNVFAISSGPAQFQVDIIAREN